MHSWKEWLPEILKGYKKEDIYNLDETGCFWRVLPDSQSGERGKRMQGWEKKQAKIYHGLYGKCFRVFDIDALPVKCYMPSAQFVDVW